MNLFPQSLKKSYLIVFQFFVVFFLLSVQYKINNVPALRPLYSLGLIFLGIFVVFNMSFRYKVNDFFQWFLNSSYLILIFLVLYILVSSIISGERETKDALYFIFWFFLIAFLFFSFCERVGAFVTVSSIIYSILIFAFWASIVAILVMWDVIDFAYGDYALVQNYWTPFRLHGFMGEPTSFGALIGLSLLCLLWWDGNKSTFYYFLLFFVFVVLLWSGSRNAIIASFFGVLVNFFVSGKIPLRISRVKFFSFFSFFSFFLVLFVFVIFFLLFMVDDFNLSVFYEQFNRNDFSSHSEDSRFYIWIKVMNLYSSGTIFDIFFGSGSGSLVATYRSAFNVPLHLLFDYGVVGVFLYLIFLGFTFSIGLVKYIETKNKYYKIGLVFFVFGVSFNMFVSWFPSSFFNFATLSLILGASIIAIPVKFKI